MPVTKSAKKKARQALAHFERNKGIRTQLKTYVKKVLVLSKTDLDGAKKLLPLAYSVIDTASKKNIIHDNTAARKKSLLARAVAHGGNKGASASAVKATPAKKEAAKA